MYLFSFYFYFAFFLIFFILQLRLWDISKRHCEWTVQAHNGQVWSITAAPDGNAFFTVGNDKTIKKWSLEKAKEGDQDLPIDTWLSDVSTFVVFMLTI